MKVKDKCPIIKDEFITKIQDFEIKGNPAGVISGLPFGHSRAKRLRTSVR